MELKTGKLRPHSRDDHITQLCRVDFDPKARCPRWFQFLSEVFGSAELIAYVQRVVGYCLTGDISEQTLFILHGAGANGKSTFLTVLQDVIGTDYSAAAPPVLLTMQKFDSHPTELAALYGRRVVVATETEVGARFAEARVKLLTGGDKIPARRMREDFWTFDPTHKLLMSTNHRPGIRGTGHAIWRRIHLIPFAQTFGDDRKDPTLPEQLQREAEGILAWAVEGCRLWREQGLNPPPEVLAATREYRTSEDVIGKFVEAKCNTGDDVRRTPYSDLYEALQHWCADNGEAVPTKKEFGQWLQSAGYRWQQSGVRLYHGIELLESNGTDGTMERKPDVNNDS